MICEKAGITVTKEEFNEHLLNYQQFRIKKSDLNIENEKKMVNLLIPREISIKELVRMGSQGDGGYVVARRRYSNHVCLGVGNNVDFENEIASHIDGRIICVDHTVRKLPMNANERLEHIKKKVSDQKGKESITLEEIVGLLDNKKKHLVKNRY